MRKFYILILLNVCLISCASFGSYGTHPALVVIKEFQTINQDENELIPYTVNIMAINLLRNNKNIKDIRNYILWYLDHLNYPDKYGLTGTMYDYIIFHNGKERSLNRYDSADSYAATFLFLICTYYEVTGSKKIIIKNRKKLEDMAYIISILRDKDGLTKAIPGTDEKYLMNNCESFGGINAFIKLSKLLHWNLVPYYEGVKESIEKGILNYFYNEKRKNFNWAIEGKYKHASNWKRYYPDSFAQLFPILYELLEGKPELREHLWKHFLKYHENKLMQVDIEQKIIYEMTQKIISKQRYK